MEEKEEVLKVIGKRQMLWQIQRQIYALELKGQDINTEWLIKILDSLEKMQEVEEINWGTKEYIEKGNVYEVEKEIIEESKILNKKIKEALNGNRRRK